MPSSPIGRAPCGVCGFHWDPGLPIEFRVFAAPRSSGWAGLGRVSTLGCMRSELRSLGAANLAEWQVRVSGRLVDSQTRRQLALAVGTCAGRAGHPAPVVKTDSRNVLWWPREVASAGSHYWRSRRWPGRRWVVIIGSSDGAVMATGGARRSPAARASRNASSAKSFACERERNLSRLLKCAVSAKRTRRGRPKLHPLNSASDHWALTIGCARANFARNCVFHVKHLAERDEAGRLQAR